MVDKKLLEILACPQCKGKVKYNAKEDCLTCVTCKLVYPVRDDIPVMLIEEASALTS
ncbi:MAG: Trm112 family protein [Mariprofundales bacterium]